MEYSYKDLLIVFLFPGILFVHLSLKTISNYKDIELNGTIIESARSSYYPFVSEP
jgi:hypothetical protein